MQIHMRSNERNGQVGAQTRQDGSTATEMEMVGKVLLVQIMCPKAGVRMAVLHLTAIGHSGLPLHFQNITAARVVSQQVSPSKTCAHACIHACIRAHVFLTPVSAPFCLI